MTVTCNDYFFQNTKCINNQTPLSKSIKLINVQSTESQNVLPTTSSTQIYFCEESSADNKTLKGFVQFSKFVG